MKEVEIIEQTNKKLTLKEARKSRGLILEVAAPKLGITVKTLWNWEQGNSFPNTKMVTKIEELYGYSYDQIIFLH